MDKILQAITKLIEDGLDWQETIICCFSIATIGFIVWVIISTVMDVIRVTIIATENILTATFRGIKNTFKSLASVSSINQPPKT